MTVYVRNRLLPLLAGLSLLVIQPAQAQINLGLTGGVNIASVSGSDVSDLNLDSDNGWAGGAYLNIGLGSKIGIEGQLLYSNLGVSNDSLSVSQDYIQIPALFKFYFGSGGTRFNIFAGPAISFSVDCTTNDDTSVDCDTAETGVWSGLIGLGVQFGRIGLEAHYQSQFSDAFQDIDASYGVIAVMARFAILGSR